MKETHSPRIIGILRGMETTFPDTLITYINEHYNQQNVFAEFVQIGAVKMHDKPRYAVILDRISHEVPFYRSYVKAMALKGTYIVNNPFWWSADDKFIDNIIAEQLGVAVPKTVILPHKDHPPNTTAQSFRNLVFPLDWEDIFAYVGFPAFLKPVHGGGWRGVTRVNNPAEFFAAYDQSGTELMMLQESIEYDRYFRCYGINQKEAYIMPYNPAALPHLRYFDVPDTPAEPALLQKIEQDVITLCRALGYDMNTVEFAVREGIPYAIDFMNPAPDADYYSVGEKHFNWVVQATARMLVEKALTPRKPRPFTANGYLEPYAE